MAGQFYPVDPAAVVRVDDLTRQAFAGTWTADNNIRVTWAPTAKQKISGWYAYQRKDDPHWLQQILFMSPEAAQHRPVADAAQHDRPGLYAATNRLLFEAGIAPGASPDTIMPAAGDTSRAFRSSSWAAPRRPVSSAYSRTSLVQRLRRPPAVADATRHR